MARAARRHRVAATLAATVALLTAASAPPAPPGGGPAGGDAGVAEDLGLPVRLLARDFTGCVRGRRCAAVDVEDLTAGPPQLVSDRDVGLSVKIDVDGSPPAPGDTGFDPARRQRWLWIFGDTSLWRRDGHGGYEPLFRGFYRTSTAGLAEYDPERDRATTPYLSPPAATAMTLRSDQVGAADPGMADFVPPDLSRIAAAGEVGADTCRPGDTPAAWPQSAVLLPGERAITLADSRRPADVAVLVFYQTFCLQGGSIGRYLDTGVALWTWSADPRLDPDQAFIPPLDGSGGVRVHALAGRTLNPRLFRNHDGRGRRRDLGYGLGATVVHDGSGTFVQVLRCHDARAVPEHGCSLARVPLTGDWTVDGPTVADPTRWHYRRADDWTPFRLAPGTAATGARPTDALDVTRGVAPTTGYVSVAWDPPAHGYVMIGMADGPGPPGTQVVVRAAPTAEGPWDHGEVVDLPAGCRTGMGCYSPTVQPQFDDPGGRWLGFSYVDHDAQVLPDPDGSMRLRQQLRIGRIPRRALR